MSGHKDLLSAVRAGDVKIVEMSRSEARDLEGLVNLDESKVEEDLLQALDEAQGEADEPGKFAYVVLKIAGDQL